jgi:hypothetical protein
LLISFDLDMHEDTTEGRSMPLEGHDYITLSKATDEQLLEEIRNRRQIVVSAWTVEDTISLVQEDEDCEGLTDAQKEAVATMFLSHARGGLLDALGGRGNDYLGDRWAIDSAEMIDLATASGPKV